MTLGVARNTVHAEAQECTMNDLEYEMDCGSLSRDTGIELDPPWLKPKQQPEQPPNVENLAGAAISTRPVGEIPQKADWGRLFCPAIREDS
jgi:hypothetical protein